MNRVYLFARQEVWFMVQGCRCGGLFSETAKEAGVQGARLALGFLEPLTWGVLYARRLPACAVFCATSRDRRLARSLQVLGKRTATSSIEQRFQMCVATNAW